MFWVAMAHVRAMAAAICSHDDCPVSSVINISGSSPPPKKFRGALLVSTSLLFVEAVVVLEEAVVVFEDVVDVAWSS